MEAWKAVRAAQHPTAPRSEPSKRLKAAARLKILRAIAAQITNSLNITTFSFAGAVSAAEVPLFAGLVAPTGDPVRREDQIGAIRLWLDWQRRSQPQPTPDFNSYLSMLLPALSRLLAHLSLTGMKERAFLKSHWPRLMEAFAYTDQNG
ncbi:hypothetical protein NA56DRAFT_700295 [Hyaloscypha hepaticicola]|uniref:Uncharacterized protein n=1 Tax=Hyaloscypha hepaticicola TaxID=2082293 RepID=A0A2J6QEF7_9HELO|nr:hypothetical protein NA56DRAFT_700295 [Hyaloscypha hepaticicola]